ncbi:fungal specific transcription factor factor [Fusarium tjaetaba]|uniref:Fungal specific transcription factor factor n=1 Tax=Fusarium tjaetaba TaxID=1567544 RepID=A0A8H5QXN8_9HYPO|nr:fungal specific transcription factor factor [Fusarium tjaetaba]KAF5622723.1 fungal specific transcription factor factor [Fusarium tjaetaba]
MPTKRLSDGMRRRCAAACESCKRRKERCDGNLPCRRCALREIASECRYSTPKRRASVSSRQSTSIGSREPPDLVTDMLLSYSAVAHDQPLHQRASQLGDSFLNMDTAFPNTYRLIEEDDQQGSLYFGDAANESFLHKIRQLVAQTLGPCPFVEQPIQYHTNRDSICPVSMSDPPPKPSHSHAKQLMNWGLQSTSHLLGALDESEVQTQIDKWLQQQDDDTASLSSAICYLILANGALTCPGDEDATAEGYYTYAKHLTNLKSDQGPNLSSILCHNLIAFYQLHSGRRDAAYHSIGVASRLACAMGIHRVDKPNNMSHADAAFRERLWKALRLFDTFASGSLGRPICTYETRNTKADKGYSSAIDMAAIIESVLRGVYGPSKVSRHFITSMTQEHRSWATRMAHGLKTDGLECAEQAKGYDSAPTLASLNMKQSYYWSIMLLTRPVLLDRVAARAMRGALSDNSYRDQDGAATPSNPDTALLYASVDSAVRITRLLQSVLTREDVPKRSPFPVHSAFTAALTLGVATFADLDQVFPLRSNLEIVRRLLQRFEKHDSIARYYWQVVQQLQSVCDEYVEQRNNRIVEKQSHLVGELFGRLQEKTPLPTHNRRIMDGGWPDEAVEAHGVQVQTPLASPPNISLTEDSGLGADLTSIGGSLDHLSIDLFQDSSLIDVPHIEDTSDVGSIVFSGLSWF